EVDLRESGMVSFVAVMQNGATVETATIGRAGVIGASAGLGARSTIARAIVQLPGTAAWISASQFHTAAAQSPALRDLIVRHNDVLLLPTYPCNCFSGVRRGTPTLPLQSGRWSTQ